MNAIETEVVLLKATKELIDSMVNFELLELLGNDPASEIRFRSATHQRFFNIVLVDFLSCTDERAIVQKTSYLSGLRTIGSNPSFGTANSVRSLQEATDSFTNWLQQEVQVDAWFPSLGAQTKVKITRLNFLKMCGDICKHNFLRSGGVARNLQETLSKSGTDIPIEDAMLALGDFYERFHTDILNYHASTIAEFLNNIRWSIYDYLQLEFNRSIVWESQDPPSYRYTYPKDLATAFAQSCYWELMNEVRMPPFVRRFQVTKYLKQKY
jgi:hypothetical protein